MTLGEWAKQNTYVRDGVKVYIAYKDSHDIIYVAPSQILSDVRFCKVLNCEVDIFDSYNIDINARDINAPIHGYRVKSDGKVRTIKGITFTDACLREGLNPHHTIQI